MSISYLLLFNVFPSICEIFFSHITALQKRSQYLNAANQGSQNCRDPEKIGMGHENIKDLPVNPADHRVYTVTECSDTAAYCP